MAVEGQGPGRFPYSLTGEGQSMDPGLGWAGLGWAGLGFSCGLEHEYLCVRGGLCKHVWFV